MEAMPVSLTIARSASQSGCCEWEVKGRDRFYEGSWQAKRESNPQPPVLETGALPIELLACEVAAV